jgi:transcription elongation factor GreA
MANISYFTPEGLEKLKAELNDLKIRGRADIARQIQEAREKGDLSENAEYDAAKEAQGLLEMNIAKLEDTLANARILDDSKVDLSKVQALTTVRLKNLGSKAEMTYSLVSEKEADFKAGKISVSSPIGQGLLGKKVGEIAEVIVPSGTMRLEVLDISRMN